MNSDRSPLPVALPKVILWVPLPNLPPVLWMKASLKLIIAKVGRLVRLDDTTEFLSKGRYTRIAVEVDISRRLLPDKRPHNGSCSPFLEDLRI